MTFPSCYYPRHQQLVVKLCDVRGRVLAAWVQASGGRSNQYWLAAHAMPSRLVTPETVPKRYSFLGARRLTAGFSGLEQARI